NPATAPFVLNPSTLQRTERSVPSWRSLMSTPTGFMAPAPGYLALRIFLFIVTAATVICATVALFSEPWSNSLTGELFIYLLIFFGIILALINIMHRPQFRIGALVIACAFLTLWIIFVLAYGRILGRNWEPTLLICFLNGTVTGGALLFRGKPGREAFAWATASLSAATGLVLLWCIWFPPADSQLADMTSVFAL